MTARGAAIQGALAVLALAVAYATWQRQPEMAPGEVVVLDVGRNQIAKIRFEDENKWAEIEPKGDEIWLRLSARSEPKVPERSLRGSEGARRLVERFAPLRANRALGTLSAEKLKEFGLDASKKKLVVTSRGGVATFLVGSSPFGVSDPYVKDERDGRVYVLGGSILGDLGSAATRLVERKLHAFAVGDYEAVALQAGGKKREWVASGSNVALARLAPVSAPDKPDSMAKNWHDKLWRLVPVDVLGQGETPASGVPQPVARVDYRAGGKSLGWIELARAATPTPESASSASPRPPEVYARTEHTAGWVKIPSSAEELLKEVDKLVSQ